MKGLLITPTENFMNSSQPQKILWQTATFQTYSIKPELLFNETTAKKAMNLPKRVDTYIKITMKV